MTTPIEFQTQYAEQKGREAIAQARATLERALRELESYGERYDSTDSLRDKANALNWTLNYLATGITPNLRLDLIADAQAELARTESLQ
jgi:hypothetical protein